MTTTVHIKANLIWKYGKSKSGNYIAVCDPIGQTIQADTFSHLIASMNEAVDSTLRELFHTGDLEKFLADRGWSSEQVLPERRKTNLRFDIPFNVRGVRGRDLHEALC